MAEKSEKNKATPWALPIALLVSAELAGTLATFMPMKSVFILAADSIPNFFPGWLRATGTVGTALLLVVLAAGLGAVATTATKTLQRYDRVKRPKGLPPRANWVPSDRRWIGPLRVTRDQAAKLLLVMVLLVSVTVVSPLFSALTVLWVGFSWVVLAYRIHTRPRRAPYATGQAEFTAVFRGWVGNSSLWCSVGGAVITLLVAPPALGLTGILLGAIFLQKAQRATAELAPVFTPPARFATKPASGGLPTELQEAMPAPFDFLSTPVGQRDLTSSFRQYGLKDVDWRVIGVPSGTCVSLMVGPRPDGTSVLLRLFSALHADLLDHEVELRELEKDSGRLGLPATGMTKVTFAGLHGLWFELGELGPEWDRPVSVDEAVTWQVRWEAEVYSDEALRSLLDNAPSANDLSLLAPLLSRSLTLRGPHQEALSKLKSRLGTLSDILSRNRTSLCLGFAARPADFIRLPQDVLAPLNVSAWRVEALGAAWSNPAQYRNAFDQTAAAMENPLAHEGVVAFVKSHTLRLLRQLRGRQLPQASSSASILLTVLDEPDEK